MVSASWNIKLVELTIMEVRKVVLELARATMLVKSVSVAICQVLAPCVSSGFSSENAEAVIVSVRLCSVDPFDGEMIVGVAGATFGNVVKL